MLGPQPGAAHPPPRRPTRLAPRVAPLLGAILLLGCEPRIAPGDPWPAPAALPYRGQARFAITDNLSDQISYVSSDPAEPRLLGSVPIGNVPVELEGPHHVAASPDGRYLYVNLSNYVPGTGSGPHGSHGTGTVPGSLLRIDAATSRKVGEVLVDRSPGEVLVSTDGRTAIVTHYDLLRLEKQLATGAAPETGYSTVAVIDTETMTRLALLPTCPTAHGAGFSLDGATLYVTCALSDELALVDISDRAAPRVLRRVPVGPAAGPLGAPAYSPYALAVSPADGTVWVSNNVSGDVRVFDPATGEMDPARTVFVGGVTMFGAFTSDGRTFYVPHQGDDQVSAIDTATLGLRNLPLPPEGCLNAHAFVMAPDDKGAVLVCEGDHTKTPGTVVSIVLPAFAATGYATVGMFPDGAVWLPPLP